jgi:hypothetical protein
MASNTTILGAAGEHYVMYQLLRRNFIAALAPVGVPYADIVVTDTVGDRLCAIQVKTRRDNPPGGPWQMKAKHETSHLGLFYAFVNVGNDERDMPRCWVIPAERVADVLYRSHRAWLSGPSTRPRNDSDLRSLHTDYDGKRIEIGCPAGWLDPYYENWQLIRAPSDQR